MLSHFNYCPLVWHISGIRNARNIENIKKAKHLIPDLAHLGRFAIIRRSKIIGSQPLFSNEWYLLIIYHNQDYILCGNIVITCSLRFLLFFKNTFSVHKLIQNNNQITTLYTNWSLYITFIMIYYIRQE